MIQCEVDKLGLGLYILYWKTGGNSLASVGQNAAGNKWFSPVNWITVPGWDWSIVDKVHPVNVDDQQYEDVELVEDTLEERAQEVANKFVSVLPSSIKSKYSDEFNFFVYIGGCVVGANSFTKQGAEEKARTFRKVLANLLVSFVKSEEKITC